MAVPAEASVTIRVVFDGAPNAGKTTAVRSLAESLGRSVLTPSEYSGRTIWFDWVDYVGGRHDGQPIRVEMVTVPGQEEYGARRRHLIDWGDVIVFVVDSSAAAIAASVEQYQRLLVLLDEIGPRPIILLANRRDADDALDIKAIREHLLVDDTVEIVESIATTGVGIRQIFVYAVREGIAFRDSGTPRAESDPDELFAELTQNHAKLVPRRAEDPPPPVLELVRDTESVAVVDPHPPFAFEADGRLALCSQAAADGRPIVLLDSEWTFIVRLMNESTTRSVDEHRDDASIIQRLVARRVLSIEGPAEPVVDRESDRRDAVHASLPEPDRHDVVYATLPEPDRRDIAFAALAEPDRRDVAFAALAESRISLLAPIETAPWVEPEPPQRIRESSYRDANEDRGRLTQDAIHAIMRASAQGFAPPPELDPELVPERDRAIRRLMKRLR